MHKKKWKPYALAALALLTTTGCAGKLVCEWESQSEQFERVLEKYYEEKTNGIPKEIKQQK